MSAPKGISAPSSFCFLRLFLLLEMCCSVGIAGVAESAKRGRRRINKVEHFLYGCWIRRDVRAWVQSVVRAVA